MKKSYSMYVTIAVCMGLLLGCVFSIGNVVTADEDLIDKNDFSLCGYTEKAEIGKSHSLLVLDEGKNDIKIEDVDYVILGDKDDITNFNRCVDLKVSVDKDIISFVGVVNKWGVYSVDIQPVIKDVNLHGVNDIGSWWNSSYGHFKQITINHSFIDDDLVNFPVLVSSSNTTMLEKMDDGDSLRFIDEVNTSEYNFEIEYFDDSDEMAVWVNITSISSSVDTVFNMYYNNSEALDGQNIEDTWNSGYESVFHMNGANWGGIDDSTVTSNDATGDSGTPVYESNGQIGYGVDFEQDSTEYLVFNNDFVPSATIRTIESWVKPEDVSGGTGFGNDNPRSLIGAYNTYTPYFRFLGSSIGIGVYSSGAWTESRSDQSVISAGNWYYVAGIIKPSSKGIMKIGTSIIPNNADDDTFGATWWEGGVGFVSNYYGNKREYDGFIDELRISNVERNDSWLNASFHTTNMTDGFLNISGEYDVPFEEILYSNSVPINNSEVLCLNLSVLSVDVNFSCGTGDFVNITLVNDTGIIFLNDTTSVVNGTYNLSLSGVNLTEGYYYIWYVNSSSSCGEINATNLSWFNFTCLEGCGCSDELAVIMYNINEIKGDDFDSEVDSLDVMLSNFGLSDVMMFLILWIFMIFLVMRLKDVMYLFVALVFELLLTLYALNDGVFPIYPELLFIIGVAFAALGAYRIIKMSTSGNSELRGMHALKRRKVRKKW